MRYVAPDYVAVFFQGLQIFIAQFMRDFVRDMNELTEAFVVVRTMRLMPQLVYRH